MVKLQGPAALAFVVTAGSALVLTTAPSAYADPLDGVREAVVNARNGSRCPALSYSIPLEGEAQHDSGNDLPGVPPAGQYHGTIQRFSNSNDPAAAAINGLVTYGPFTTAIDDCSWKDFGVGFYRLSDLDYVSVVLGKPAPAPAPPANTGPTYAPQAPQTATVTGGDLPVYNIAHDDVKDPATGVQGLRIATLPNGTVVTFDGVCQSGWCRIKSPLIPSGFGFAQEQFLML
jgi:hypothetical protein